MDIRIGGHELGFSRGENQSCLWDTNRNQKVCEVNEVRVGLASVFS